MLISPLHKKYWSFGSSEGLYVICLYIIKTKIMNKPTLNTMKGATHATLTYEEFEAVFMLGLEADDNDNIGTSIGGTLMKSNWKLWLPEALAGLILL